MVENLEKFFSKAAWASQGTITGIPTVCDLEAAGCDVATAALRELMIHKEGNCGQPRQVPAVVIGLTYKHKHPSA